MGPSCFQRACIVLVLLVLSSSLSHGSSRKLMETLEFPDFSFQLLGTAEEAREMLEALDYNLDPQPNVNRRTGYIYSPPPQG